MKTLDAADLLAAPPTPISWAVEGILPVGTVGDLAGPPGEGKSTLVLDLSMAIASGCGSWYGHPCIGGKVVLLGGERGSDATLARDLHRIHRGRTIERDRLLAPSSDDDHPPIWHWHAEGWVLTSWGKTISAWLQQLQPAMVILDTHMSVTAGTVQVDNAQQYAYGVELRRWAKALHGPVVLTLSHTNQLSAGQALSSRLHYLSRAGGNGLPGALRWAAGLSRLRPDDALAKQLGLEHRAEQSWLVALAISKANEMPRCPWSPGTPAIFELLPDGGIELLAAQGNATSTTPPKARRERTAAWLSSRDFPGTEVRHVPHWL